MLKHTRTLRAALAVSALSLTMAACGGGSSDTASSGGDSGGGDEPYVAIISKGFQHQFWQAVRLGAEQAAEDCGVTITFEGPETEAMVDRHHALVSQKGFESRTRLFALKAASSIP